MGIALSVVVIVLGMFILYLTLTSIDKLSLGKELQITTKNILEQIENLYNQKEYTILEILAKKYLERVPKHYKVRCYLVKCYYDTNKIKNAIYESLKVLKYNKEQDDIRLILAHCYRKKNLSLEALKQFEVLYKRGDRSVEIIKNMAELFNIVNQYGASIKLYNTLIPMTKNEDDIAEYKLILSRLNEKIGDYAAAFEAYKSRIEYVPEDFDTRKKMIQLYVKVENHLKAISAIEDLLSFNIPDELRLWALELIVKICGQCGEYVKALQYCEELLKCPGCNELDTICKLVDIHLTLDNSDAAESILLKAQGVYNNNIEILTRLSRVYEKQDRFSEANDIYNGLLTIIPSTEVRKIHNLMSNLYARWGTALLKGSELSDVTESFKLFSMAIQLDISNPYVHEQLAKANMLIKNYKEAISQLNIAIENSEEHEHTKYYLPLAECYHNINNAYEEKKILLKLIKVEPDNAEAYWQLAQLCESQHDVKSARNMLEKTVELDTSKVEPKYRLALIYEKDGLAEQSIKLYRQILKLEPDNVEVQNNLETLLSFTGDIQTE